MKCDEREEVCAAIASVKKEMKEKDSGNK